MKTILVLLVPFLLIWSSGATIIVSVPRDKTSLSNQQSQVADKFFRSGISITAMEDLNCKVKGKGKCQKCYQSFYYNLVTKTCVPVSPLCLTWNDDGDCLSCFEGYKLISGICAIETDADLIGQIKDPNCFSYENGTCVACAYRFYFNREGICTTVHPDCKTWENETGACTSCFDGFELRESKCLSLTGSKIKLSSFVPAPPSTDLTFVEIPNCAEYNGPECAVCAFRYYYSNGSCHQVSDLCKSWSNIDGTCTNCYSGYDLWDGRCTVRDPFCTIKVTGMCVQCANRYYLDIHLKCQGVSPLCKAYDPLAGTCTDCYDGYQLQENGICAA